VRQILTEEKAESISTGSEAAVPSGASRSAASRTGTTTTTGDRC
jgi:hypothetical protein